MGAGTRAQAGVLAEGALPGPHQAVGLADGVAFGEGGQRHHAGGLGRIAGEDHGVTAGRGGT